MKTLTPGRGRAVAPLTFPKGLGKRGSRAAVNPLSSCRRQPRSSPWLLFRHCCVGPGEQGGPRLVISLPRSTFKKKNRHLIGSSWPWETFKQKQGKSCLVSLKISVRHEAAVSLAAIIFPSCYFPCFKTHSWCVPSDHGLAFLPPQRRSQVHVFPLERDLFSHGHSRSPIFLR